MLQKLGFAPGFNKQVTETGAEGQWFDGDNVRFRYGTPEKIGGWQQLGENKLTGAARAIHHWDDNAGIKYAAIGTNRILYVYSGGTYYDIHPIRTTLTGATFTSTISLFNADDTAFDITDHTGAGQIRKSYSSSSASATFTISFASDRTSGQITLSLTPTQTADLEEGR